MRTTIPWQVQQTARCPTMLTCPSVAVHAQQGSWGDTASIKVPFPGYLDMASKRDYCWVYHQKHGSCIIKSLQVCLRWQLPSSHLCRLWWPSVFLLVGMDIEANDSGRFPTVVVKTAAQPGRTAAVCTGEIIFVAEAGKSFSLEFKCVCVLSEALETSYWPFSHPHSADSIVETWCEQTESSLIETEPGAWEETDW